MTSEEKSITTKLRERADRWQVWIDDDLETEVGYLPEHMRYHQKLDRDASDEIERLARELAEARAENEHRERYWAQFEHVPKSGPGRVEKLRAAGVRVTVIDGPDALVGALQDKVHEDKGPFRAGYSVKHDDVGDGK